MNRYKFIVLIVFLVTGTTGQLIKADNSSFEAALVELCNAHYLSENIVIDTYGSSQAFVWLSDKVWSNPKDTRKFVNSIKLLAETSDINKYEISVFGKPSLSNRIAQITVGPIDPVIDYTYDEAKWESFAFRRSFWEKVESLKIRGLTIYKGLHADSVFRVISKSDGISGPDVKRDEKGGLIITHHWKVDDQFIGITFRRWDNMYRVESIRVFDINKERQKEKEKKANLKATASQTSAQASSTKVKHQEEKKPTNVQQKSKHVVDLDWLLTEAQWAVDQVLHDPGSAEFEYINESAITRFNPSDPEISNFADLGTVYRITGVVRAKNAFGAYVRSVYKIDVQFLVNGEYIVRNIQIE